MKLNIVFRDTLLYLISEKNSFGCLNFHSWGFILFIFLMMIHPVFIQLNHLYHVYVPPLRERER